MKYEIDLKVYTPAHLYEIPFWMPNKILNGSRLVPGYHYLTVEWPEETMEAFLTWAYKNGNTLKVLGHEKIAA